jgi:hypothetical protein
MTTMASPPRRIDDTRSDYAISTRAHAPQLDTQILSVFVLESCHSTWIFDPSELKFSRVLKGVEFGGRPVSTEWRPYYQVHLDAEAEGFTVYLNAARTRLIRSWRHTQDCRQCGGSETTELSLEDVQHAIDGSLGPRPVKGGHS